MIPTKEDKEMIEAVRRSRQIQVLNNLEREVWHFTESHKPMSIMGDTELIKRALLGPYQPIADAFDKKQEELDAVNHRI